ncbi:LysR family transcriptional regulator [Citreimonas salinaria]|uniref:DNA-binding transcriptional regulator, LysR family n=1 Tax=Citreimonas salinaria TaxID=321339 RepID=A0A1H3JV40_9RHOB|nr:LysR family transcriptional regulator [Citreimonas salinaria]SDY43783.1 DNA-binding transcriptional regulator, LysR family [Citreimonas salinaria]
MLDKLEMFLAVSKEQHFGRAAESLGITQPTLSAGIKNLEEQLGVQLIFRGSRYGGLTPEGQSTLIWARRIVGDARQLRQEMRALRHGLAGTVRFAVIPTALTRASTLMARFARRHPAVRFTVLSRSSIDILQMIDNLDADAGLSYLDNEPLGRVSTQPLYREHYHLICASNAPLAGRASVTWADLRDAPLCLLTPEMQNRRIINRCFMLAGIEPQAMVESNSTVMLVAHVEQGDWMTILPAEMAAFLTAGKPLASVPIEGGEQGHAVGLVAPYRDPHTPVIAALLAEARRMAAET